MIQTLKNESTITNADSNVYMKYMSDFIIYLYTMDKLIELLNEYDGKDLEYGFIDGEIRRKVRNFDDERNTWKQVVWYTKQFGFIQWLVENDKIDFDNRDLKDRFMNEFERYPRFQNNTTNREFNINGLLMLLSISDEPISDLISMLK